MEKEAFEKLQLEAALKVRTWNRHNREKARLEAEEHKDNMVNLPGDADRLLKEAEIASLKMQEEHKATVIDRLMQLEKKKEERVQYYKLSQDAVKNSTENIKLSELERRKKELAERRGYLEAGINPNSDNTSKIAESPMLSPGLESATEKKPSKGAVGFSPRKLESIFTKKIKEEDQQRKLDRLKFAEEKKEMYAKRKVYGDQIKDMLLALNVNPLVDDPSLNMKYPQPESLNPRVKLDNLLNGVPYAPGKYGKILPSVDTSAYVSNISRDSPNVLNSVQSMQLLKIKEKKLTENIDNNNLAYPEDLRAWKVRMSLDKLPSRKKLPQSALKAQDHEGKNQDITPNRPMGTKEKYESIISHIERIEKYDQKLKISKQNGPMGARALSGANLAIQRQNKDEDESDATPRNILPNGPEVNYVSSFKAKLALLQSMNQS